METIKRYRPNWKRKCENCGSSSIVPVSGLCGPCHFGTADGVGGGWWDEQKDDFDEAFVTDHLDAEAGDVD